MLKKIFSQPSVIVLILVNFVPLAEVLFLNWSIGQILYLYLIESGIIGFFNVLRMRYIKTIEKQFFSKDEAIFLFIMIFCVSIIMTYGGLKLIFGWLTTPFDYFDIYSVSGLFLSHTFSFFTNYIKGKEFETNTLSNLFWEPLPRVLIIQLTIILGAYFTYTMGNLKAIMMAFVFLKIIVDCLFHINQHKKSWQLRGLL